MKSNSINLYNDLFYMAPIGYVLFDEEYRLLKVNNAFCELIEKSVNELIGTKFTDNICSANLTDFYKEMDNMKDETKKVQLILKTYDMSTYVNIVCNYIKSEGNDYIGCALVDITDEKNISKKLEYLSFHDQLTNLYNRRFFDEEIKRLDVLRNLPLTLIMADVNGLKLVNDSFGHKAGDELLVKVANSIKSGCREDDIIVRVSGDEFVILLPKTDTIAAKVVIDRIKGKLKLEEIRTMEISVSFGHSTKLEETDNIDDIYKAAEDIMYSRKLFESPSMRSKAINTVISAFYRINPAEELHSKNVGYLCGRLAEAMGCPEYMIKEMGTIGLIHDIGKMGIDNEILKKDYDKLNEKEWNEIKRHPEIGYQIIGSVHEMADLAQIILTQHEKWDGTGYPKGLKYLDIPKRARILSICDAYDFMISPRVYRDASNEDYAVNEIIKNAGTQFDPELARIFVEKALNKPWKVLEAVNSEQ